MVITIVKGDDGITRVLVEKDRKGKDRTVTYHKVTPTALRRLQRLTWKNSSTATPFFTEDYVGFTLHL